MSDYDIPKIDVEVSSEPTTAPETQFIHVSDVEPDSISQLHEVYIYTYSDNEKQIERLKEVVENLEQDYILSIGVVFPDWMEDEMDELTNDMLESVVLLYRIDEKVRKDGLQPDQLEQIKEYHE